MSAIILALSLLASGIWADGLPEKDQQDRIASFVLTNHRPVEPSQNYSEILRKSESVVKEDQSTVKIHQDDSKFINERASNIVQDQQNVKNYKGNECDFPFVAVGDNCYFFSEEQKTFEEAEEYCESFAHGHSFQSSLAMLDYSESEDQELLKAVTAKQNTYWVGGKTNDGSTWTWIDKRDIFIYSPFWYYQQPIQGGNQCTAAKVSVQTDHRKRSYIHGNNCDDSFNFICQVGCPTEFRKIQDHCYFLSEDAGFDDVTWQDARDYCQSLSVPAGHHTDLAVLGLQTQDTYHLMNSIAAGYTSFATWLGAYKESECLYKWIDGRSLTTDSIYWVYDEPHCGSFDSVRFRVRESIMKTWIADAPGTNLHPFICQMFRNDQQLKFTTKP